MSIADRFSIHRVENQPKFCPFDPYGHRIDEIEFHPAYHRIMQLGFAHGVPNFAWRHEDHTGAHVARAALAYLHMQPEQGDNCPLTMTYSSVPVLRHHAELAADWLPRITSPEYDSRVVPAWNKHGNTIGMGMTEKQGGSDVRANTTRAHAVGTRGPGQLYELVGHKWFFSAPMCDAFLVLAHTDAGLTCFLMPRFAPVRAEKAEVANTFCESRLGEARGLCFGTLPASAPLDLLIARAFPDAG